MFHGKEHREQEVKLNEELIAEMGRAAAAQEAIAAAHNKHTDAREKALNLTLAHANYISNIEGNAEYLRDFPGLMAKAEMFLAFLLDDRVD